MRMKIGLADMAVSSIRPQLSDWHMRRFLAAATFCICMGASFAPSRAFASEESPAVFGEFSISSAGFGNSGPIRVTGDSLGTRISRLKINAFGATYEATASALDKLAGMHVNGIQISYDGGYGRGSFIVVLSSGYFVGVVDKRYVIVTKGKPELDVRSDL
jgi:hypothetical protein